MSNTNTTLKIAALALTIGLSGCAMDETEMELGRTGQEALLMNGLMMNGLMMNGLMMNGLPDSNVANNGMTTERNTEWHNWLNDTTYGTANDALMSYIARCALPANASTSFADANGVVRSWQGQLGLAPSWSNGPLNDSKQKWVSSCVLSLVNALGQNVAVSQRGPNGSHYNVSSQELQDWDAVEGAFFGSIFDGQMYSCSFSNDYTDPGNGRICTMTDEFGNSLCNPIEALGLCSDICDVETRTEAGQSYTVFTNCEGADGTIYAEVTTTALNI